MTLESFENVAPGQREDSVWCF